MSMDESDWRLVDQEQYLTGVMLFRRTWKQSRPSWDHDHCEFCGAKSSTASNDLHEGWATEDEYHWICRTCFTDFRERFGWINATE